MYNILEQPVEGRYNDNQIHKNILEQDNKNQDQIFTNILEQPVGANYKFNRENFSQDNNPYVNREAYQQDGQDQQRVPTPCDQQNGQNPFQQNGQNPYYQQGNNYQQQNNNHYDYPNNYPVQNDYNQSNEFYNSYYDQNYGVQPQYYGQNKLQLGNQAIEQTGNLENPYYNNYAPISNHDKYDDNLHGLHNMNNQACNNMEQYEDNMDQYGSFYDQNSDSFIRSDRRDSQSQDVDYETPNSMDQKNDASKNNDSSK